MRLVINADDFGLTRGISQSIIELFQANAISNTTVMVGIHGVEARCMQLKQSGFAKYAGTHLQTTFERHHNQPISDPKDIPSLLASSGGFPAPDADIDPNPSEVELEWRAQIERFIALFGHHPTHIDSHHGRHRIPSLTPV